MLGTSALCTLMYALCSHRDCTLWSFSFPEYTRPYMSALLNVCECLFLLGSSLMPGMPSLRPSLCMAFHFMQVVVRPVHLTSLVFDIWDDDSIEEFPFRMAGQLKRLCWDSVRLDCHQDTIASFSQLTDLQISLGGRCRHQDIQDWPQFPVLSKLGLSTFEASKPYILHPFIHLARFD